MGWSQMHNPQKAGSSLNDKTLKAPSSSFLVKSLYAFFSFQCFVYSNTRQWFVFECPPQIQGLYACSLADGTVGEVAKLLEVTASQVA